MRTLEFTVTGQQLKKKPSCDFSGLVAGSKGYLRAKFYFSPDWDGCKKAASFWRDGQEYGIKLDADDSCPIPPAALNGERFEVSVTGAKADYLIKTNKTKVRQEVY